MNNCLTVEEDVSRGLITSAVELGRQFGASDILLCTDIFEDFGRHREMLRPFPGARFVLATAHPPLPMDPPVAAIREIISVPDIPLTRMGQIKVAVLVGISAGVLRRGDNLVCLAGPAEKRALDTVMLMEVGKEFEMFAPDVECEIGQRVNISVFNEVLKLAVTLFNEGREGKPIGTMFVIGDPSELLPYARQMVLNPFRGYEAHERRIFDRNVQETLKEFALIDGAFLITNEGLVEAAGVYLSPPSAGVDIPRGLGTRHHVASGITQATTATAITVSETNGTVTVFQKGRVFIEIEAPRRVDRSPLSAIP
jgi:DNA integrity scanning protein DisA with diadenylate cyclase activity